MTDGILHVFIEYKSKNNGEWIASSEHQRVQENGVTYITKALRIKDYMSMVYGYLVDKYMLSYYLPNDASDIVNEAYKDLGDKVDFCTVMSVDEFKRAIDCIRKDHKLTIDDLSHFYEICLQCDETINESKAEAKLLNNPDIELDCRLIIFFQ